MSYKRSQVTWRAVFWTLPTSSTWTSQEEINNFLAQIQDNKTRAPCPAGFPVPQHATSFWINQHPIQLDNKFKDAVLPTDVDVAIIGSGITGATIAYQLSKQRPELRVAVLEDRGICTGATGRNGGHLCRPEVYGIRAAAEHFGVEDAIIESGRASSCPLDTMGKACVDVYRLQRC
ncbi:hypothetical protein BDW69DRAFT_189167 [Aspergillus filifer]